MRQRLHNTSNYDNESMWKVGSSAHPACELDTLPWHRKKTFSCNLNHTQVFSTKSDKNFHLMVEHRGLARFSAELLFSFLAHFVSWGDFFCVFTCFFCRQVVEKKHAHTATYVIFERVSGTRRFFRWVRSCNYNTPKAYAWSSVASITGSLPRTGLLLMLRVRCKTSWNKN